MHVILIFQSTHFSAQWKDCMGRTTYKSRSALNFIPLLGNIDDFSLSNGSDLSIFLYDR